MQTTVMMMIEEQGKSVSKHLTVRNLSLFKFFFYFLWKGLLQLKKELNCEKRLIYNEDLSHSHLFFCFSLTN